MRNFNISTDELTRSSVPVFVRTQEIGRNLKRLLLILQDTDDISDLSELEPLQTAFDDHLQIVNEEIEKLTQTRSSVEAVEIMSDTLPVIALGAKQLFASKRDLLLFKLTLSQVEIMLNQSRILVRNSLEDLAFKASSNFARSFATGSGPFDLARLDQEYAFRLGQANAITELTLEIDSIIDSAVRLENIEDTRETDQIINEIRFKSRGISVLISQLEKSPARRLIAEEFIAIRNYVFGEMGIIDHMSHIHALQAEIDKHRAEQVAPILELSEISNRLIDEARVRVNEARNNLSTTLQQMITVLIVSGMFSIFIFSAASFIVVERQINQRMAKLTKAVSAIAAGDTTYKVDATGQDELTEMAKALETFKNNAEELRRSNFELEKFAYVAAHDLRSPLRAIQNLAEWTLEDTENTFSKGGRENMDMLQSRVRRLNLLLTDLLAYSRVGKEGADLSEISIAETVRETRNLLDPQGLFDITYIGVSSDVVTYSTPLQQILLNLISNSIKHHDKGHGTITVYGMRSDGRLLITIRDDGPGIDPQYHEKVFDLFQTLRPRDEVEGSGFGLAIVRKLVEHYGGEIKLSSDPRTARGTIFKFDLPEKSDDLTKRDKAA